MGILNESEGQNLENITAPLDDVERWVIATYAMWSEYYSEGNWQYIAGSPVKEENASNMQLMLSRDWGIDNKEDLLDTITYLTALYMDDENVDQEDIETGAWDLCRACQILGMAFVAGIIDREEMMGVSLMVCNLMQYYYPSWMHLYSSYLNGYRAWRLEDDDDYDYEDDDENAEYEDDDIDEYAEFEDDDIDEDEEYEDDDIDEEDDEEALGDIEAREQICQKLLIMPGGPCSLPWDLELPIEFEDEDEE